VASGNGPESWCNMTTNFSPMASPAVKIIVVAMLIPVGFLTARWIRSARPWETLTDRVHRLCRECGLDIDAIDRIIDDVRHSTLTRQENLGLFYATFQRRADAELCRPCAEAVLDAGYGNWRGLDDA
jgi:hypothetical protein